MSIKEETKGLYRQPCSSNWWLRFSAGGKQHRLSLGTSSLPEAISKAKSERQRVTVEVTDDEWEVAVTAYLARKERAGKFRARSIPIAFYALKKFKEWSRVKTPAEATTKMLRDFYHHLKGQNESTAQTYTARTLAFLRDRGLKIGAVEFTDPPTTRTTVISKIDINCLIGYAAGDGNFDLTFVLMSGFYCGLRRSEIIACTPSWLIVDDYENSVIRIPKKDPVTGFVPKSRRAREIPLIPDFVDYLKQKREVWESRPYMIAPDNCTKEKSGKLYRYDFRRPFEQHVKKHFTPAHRDQKLTIHSMRHSYITHLLNDGVPPSVVAALSGDREETVFSNYAHASTSAFSIAKALSSMREHNN
jgi:integrase